MRYDQAMPVELDPTHPALEASKFLERVGWKTLIVEGNGGRYYDILATSPNGKTLTKSVKSLSDPWSIVMWFSNRGNA